MELHLPSPAKINLFLHIVGQREDGYHLLQTGFQFIDLCDAMRFKLRKDTKIQLSTQHLELQNNDNLVVKAAHLLQGQTKKPKGIDIELDKKIPLGAGLGGGSSNAATTLIALNWLWGLNLQTSDLAEMGLTLGADVPIFLYGKAAFAEGVGEKLQPLEVDENWILLAFPGCEVMTAKIFSDSQLTRNTPEITIREFLTSGGKNDCEPVAKKHFPEIAYALDCLNQHAKAQMTGTGSAIFAIFNEKQAGAIAIEKLPKSLNGILVKGLNNSPLHVAIKNYTWGVAKW